VKHCSSCGREIRESVTLCEQCERWAAGSVVEPGPDAPPVAVVEAPPAPVVDARPVVEPLGVPAAAPPPPFTRGFGRRGLFAIAGAVVIGGLVTFAILSARGPSASVAAARVVAPTLKPAPSAVPPPATTVSQRWSSENRAYWVGTEKKSAAFELPAEKLVTIWMNQVRPLLVVRCVAKSTEVFVWTGSALAMEAQTEDHTVTYRLDDEAEITERWPDSAEHDALFTRDGAAFTQRLIDARTMRIGYTPHNAAPVVAEFQVSGLGDLVGAFAKECGWPSPAKATASLPTR
jgi:hypothetical protein